MLINIRNNRLSLTNAVLVAGAVVIGLPLISLAADERLAVVATVSAVPLTNPLLTRQINFDDESRQAQEVNIRRNTNRPAVQERIVRSEDIRLETIRGQKKNSDKVLILGGSAVEPM